MIIADAFKNFSSFLQLLMNVQIQIILTNVSIYVLTLALVMSVAVQMAII